MKDLSHSLPTAIIYLVTLEEGKSLEIALRTLMSQGYTCISVVPISTLESRLKVCLP